MYQKYIARLLYNILMDNNLNLHKNMFKLFFILDSDNCHLASVSITKECCKEEKGRGEVRGRKESEVI